MNSVHLKTTGLVLSRDPYKEYDRTYSFLSKDFGKIRFIGRGAQREKAKLAPHLESFALVDVEFVRSKFTTVISVERKRIFANLESDIEKRICANVVLRYLDRFLHDEDEDKDLYDFVVGFLIYLDDLPEGLSNTRLAAIMAGFLLQFMDRLGYRVELDHCLECRSKIMPLSYRWHPLKGGLVCTECLDVDRSEWVSARLLDERVISLMRVFRQRELDKFMSIGLPGAVVEELLKVVHDLQLLHLPRPFEDPFWQAIQFTMSTIEKAHENE